MNVFTTSPPCIRSHPLSCLFKDTDPTILPSLASSIFPLYWITAKHIKCAIISLILKKKKTKNLPCSYFPLQLLMYFLPSFPLELTWKHWLYSYLKTALLKVTSELLIVKSCDHFLALNLSDKEHSCWHSWWCLFLPRNTFSLGLQGTTFTSSHLVASFPFLLLVLPHVSAL